MKTMSLSRTEKLRTRREGFIRLNLKHSLFSLGFLLVLLVRQPGYARSSPVTPTPTPDIAPVQAGAIDDQPGRSLPARIFPEIGVWSDLFFNWSTNDHKFEKSSLPIYSQTIIEKDPEEDLALLSEVEGLNQKWRRSLLTQAGWIHRLVRMNIWSDGSRSNYDLEGWYLIDPQDGMLRAYERITLPDGLKVGERVFINGNWKETGSTPLPPDPFLAKLIFDLGFSVKTASLLSEGGSLSRMTLYENCWYMGEVYTLAHGDERLSALFFPDTGKLRRLEAWQLAGESIQNLWRLNLSIEEPLIQLPDWLSGYLNE